jgi:hypothetical protein
MSTGNKRLWSKHQKEPKQTGLYLLDQATERYYRSLGKSEQMEDVEWAALGHETVRERWVEADE